MIQWRIAGRPGVRYQGPWHARFVGGPWDGQTRAIDPVTSIVLHDVRMVGGGRRLMQYRLAGADGDLMRFDWEDVVYDD